MVVAKAWKQVFAPPVLFGIQNSAFVSLKESVGKITETARPKEVKELMGAKQTGGG